MNKKFFLLGVLILWFSLAFASEVKIAAIAVYDNNGNKTNVPFDASKAIHSELEKHWFKGLVSFSHVSDQKYGIPISIIDANKICSSENIEYLIYGYIKKSDSNWFCEIKLYGETEKKILKEFFASDNINHYDRLIDTLCQNILFGIEELTGLNQKEIKQKKNRELELRIPVSLCYWSPVDSEWGSKILGIAGANAGLEFYPSQSIIISNGRLVDFSAKLNLSWDIGMNKSDIYPLLINTISISLPIILHLHFNEYHSLYGGVGLAYNIELMKIRPKYENETFLYQNIFSFETLAGYEYNLNKYANLFMEIIFDYHLVGDGFVSVKPCLGASFKIFKEKR